MKLVNDYCTHNTPDAAIFTSPIYLASQSKDRQTLNDIQHTNICPPSFDKHAPL